MLSSIFGLFLDRRLFPMRPMYAILLHVYDTQVTFLAEQLDL